MSILMQALKQQHQTAAVVADGSAFWRKLALALALLLALLTGAVAAYLLMPLVKPTVTPAAEVVIPAQPEAILAALSHAGDAVVDKAAADKTAPAVVTELTRALTPQPLQPQVVQEQLASEPAMAMVTAGTAAAEPQPLIAATPEPAVDPEVSAELRDKFASAIEATEDSRRSNTVQRNAAAPARDINSLERQLQQQIPPLRFDAHVYATTASQRWVKVNGKTLQEGQWVTADIRIKEITPQFVLLQWGSQLFSMAALTEWPGS
ncbi:general secretion pathway protein GspB [Rheinheimera sp. YQF-2]|uniref:General secretion pathway protein GspB n=1 Tax=Rheinheimera lutimaris TaxID=2740584 RepID=A0A7Y5EJ62_9GAMM|nr:general secretion pathway protein GspB [Rheinheimera lutimaris]NRQ44234.1 general secretion pathway protein GspB [Rheinheimera lutimaris]